MSKKDGAGQTAGDDEDLSVSLSVAIPDNCTVTLPEGVVIPPPKPSALPSQSDHSDTIAASTKEYIPAGTVDDVHAIGGLYSARIPFSVHPLVGISLVNHVSRW